MHVVMDHPRTHHGCFLPFPTSHNGDRQGTKILYSADTASARRDVVMVTLRQALRRDIGGARAVVP
jgi:hypothetical protein